MDLYFGETAAFWLELKKKVEQDGLGTATLLRDNIKLRAKVNFFESQHADAVAFVGAVRDLK